MNVNIDGKVVEVFEDDKNIVEVADREGIGIVAPCLRAKRKNGCCMACVIEVDGQQEYACATKPVDGMDIVLNTEKLKELRNERIKEYRENPGAPCCVESAAPTSCGSSCCSDKAGNSNGGCCA